MYVISFTGKKRSVAPSLPKKADSSAPESNLNPHAFNMQEHGKRLRRQITASPPQIEYILFLLDTSGSIGPNSFRRMKNALSKLVFLFCNPVQVAVMTFNQDYKLEFCFNCHDNDLYGRFGTSEAIKNIEYRNGWTHTGGAAKCACERILHPSCGVPTHADSINVVFVTDGNSNDPSREICKEVECLHDRLGVNTYAIGINNYDHNELKCITKSSNLMNLFSFGDFDEFIDALEQIRRRVENEVVSGKDFYACYDPQNSP